MMTVDLMESLVNTIRAIKVLINASDSGVKHMAGSCIASYLRQTLK